VGPEAGVYGDRTGRRTPGSPEGQKSTMQRAELGRQAGACGTLCGRGERAGRRRGIGCVGGEPGVSPDCEPARATADRGDSGPEVEGLRVQEENKGSALRVRVQS